MKAPRIAIKARRLCIIELTPFIFPIVLLLVQIIARATSWA
jgi:hypothetical protein